MTDQSNDKISRRQTLAALLAASMVPAVPRSAAAADPDFGGFNAGFGTKIILPAFDRLVAVTADYAKTAAAFAAKPDAAGLEAVKNGFNDVSDAWASAQQFRVGALAQGQRSERFAYWPERRNVVEKQYRALLAGKSTDGLGPEQIAKASVAVQGLPTLERILYGEDKGADLLKGDSAERRRAIVAALAANLHAIAVETQAAWADTLKDPAKAANSFAASPGEGTAQSYTNLLTITQVVAEQKLGAPLGGAEAVNAKPKAAEQWRSGRSVRNIVLNLETAKVSVLSPGGYADLLPASETALKADIAKAFDDAIASANAVGDDFTTDITQAEKRKAVTGLLVKVNHLRDLLRQKVPPLAGITLGFNELDGDGS